MARGGRRIGAGRKPNAVHHQAAGIAAFAQSIVDDEAYRALLVLRAKNGALPPPIEAMLWHYAYGKPTEPARDDQRFLEELLAVVLKHVGTAEARQEIRAVIDAHTGATGLRAVA